MENNVLKVSNNKNISTTSDIKNPSLHIVFIGESANPHKWGYNHYFHNTTPKFNQLAKNTNTIYFNYAYSKYGSTVKVLFNTFIKNQESLFNIAIQIIILYSYTELWLVLW